MTDEGAVYYPGRDPYGVPGEGGVALFVMDRDSGKREISLTLQLRPEDAPRILALLGAEDPDFLIERSATAPICGPKMVVSIPKDGPLRLRDLDPAELPPPVIDGQETLL